MSGLIGASNEFGKQLVQSPKCKHAGHQSANPYSFIFQGTPADLIYQTAVTSIYYIGCAVGCLLSFVMATDSVERR